METKDHRGLSPSSLAMFLGCNRKYFHKKIAKTPIDADAGEDLEAFQVGKLFHLILENTKHNLDGLRYGTVEFEATKFDLLNKDTHVPMVFAMLGSYKRAHLKAGLKAIACETVVDTDEFYGIVDVVLENDDGWWIGDMKTAGSYTENLIPQLPHHQQLNLYAKNYARLAEILKIDPDRFRGCRYRMTTKSRMVRKATEPVESYIARVAQTVKTIDFILPKEILSGDETAKLHSDAVKFIAKNKTDKKYPPNFGSCMQYFRPCEWWSQCHGKTFTEMKTIDYVTSEDAG